MAIEAPPLEILLRLLGRLQAREGLLDEAVRCAAALTESAASLLYLWDESRSQLVLRAATDGFEPWVGHFAIDPGEGLTGWTALHGRSATVSGGASADVRWSDFPELNDSLYPSALTVPIAWGSGRVAGVLVLQHTEVREYTPVDIDRMEALAAMVGIALENDHLLDRLSEISTVSTQFAEISQLLSTDTDRRQVLQRIAIIVLDVLRGSTVSIMRLEDRPPRLLLETWAGLADFPRGPVVLADAPYRRLLPGAAAPPLFAEPSLVGGLGLSDGHSEPLIIPLLDEGRLMGIATCYGARSDPLREAEIALLWAARTLMAAALGAEQDLIDDRRRAHEVIEALRAGERPVRAEWLGLDLDRPHVVVMIESEDGDAFEAWPRAASKLRKAFPGVLADALPQVLTAIVPVHRDNWASSMQRVLQEVHDDAHANFEVPVKIGYSDSTGTEGDFPLAFRQARLACAIARSTQTRSVQGYNSLGAQRYLWVMSRNEDPDRLELAVRELLRIDEGRGSQLFRTLEAYLEHQGNARETAAALFVHRNTLRFRLGRISETVGIDVTQPANWFDLMLVVKLIRFRDDPERSVATETHRGSADPAPSSTDVRVAGEGAG